MASVRTVRKLSVRVENTSLSKVRTHMNDTGRERSGVLDADNSEMTKRDAFERRARTRAKIEADRDPPSIDAIGTYAVMLATVFRDADHEAETYFKKVICVYESLHPSSSSASNASSAPAFCMYVTSYASYALHTKKNPVLAASLLERVLIVDPKHPAALGDLAMLKHMYPPYDTDAAEKLYEKAVALHPEHATVVGAYANFLKTIRKNLKRSEVLFRQALDIAPKHPQCLGNFAVLLHGSLGRHDEAEQYYERAIEADETDANNHGNFALFLTEVRKDHDEAERLYARAIELDSRHANSLYNFGVFVESIRNDRTKAETLYRRSIDADPRHVFARHALASLLDDMRKNADEAETHFQVALELAPTDTLILNDYAAFLTNTRQGFAKATKIYRASLDVDDSQIDARYNLAYLLKVKCGKVREASNVLEALLKRDPSHATAIGLLANIKAAEGQGNAVGEALKLYARACVLDPTNATNISNYAQCLHREWKVRAGGCSADDETSTKTCRQIRELYDRAMDLDGNGGKKAPPNAYYNYVAFLMDDIRDYDAASRISNQAAKAYPQSEDIRRIRREVETRKEAGV